MDYQRELAFVRKLLDNFFIPLTLLGPEDVQPVSAPWSELRRRLQPAPSPGELYASLSQRCKPQVIYRHRDELDCNMLLFQVPDGKAPALAVVGPYLLQPLSQELLASNAAKFPDPKGILHPLERYYREVPCLPNENQLLVLLYTLGEFLWDGGVTVQDLPAGIPAPALDGQGMGLADPSGSTLSREALENRYAEEERLIRAVSAGQADQAALSYSRFSTRQMERRTTPPLRDMKNYFVVLNTLLRKAAEYGNVHPLYIDELSSSLARQIESTPSTDALAALGPKMVRHYCQLVQDFSLKGRSHLISKLLIHIDADLTADLSLSALAKLLNVNSSYLSALFKKELGSTLTEYVSTRRVKYAMFLLSTTNLQVQAIAQHCGIPDVNYFTRTFKRYAGVTPKEYRAVQRAM